MTDRQEKIRAGADRDGYQERINLVLADLRCDAPPSLAAALGRIMRPAGATVPWPNDGNESAGGGITLHPPATAVPGIYE
jgi:hypothetical protein